MFSFLKKKEVEVKAEEPKQLQAYLSGKMVSIREVPDPVFSSEMLGTGVAIIPENEIVTAPIAGTIAVVTEDSKHSCGIRTEKGFEVLIHVGLDTVKMNGDGFKLFVKMGDQVKEGDKLISFSKDKIREAGFQDMVMLVITNKGEAADVKFVPEQEVKAGDVIAEIQA